MDKYKLVPVEPTREMINAGYAAMRKNASGERLLGMTAECAIYDAMLATAPSPEGIYARIAELEAENKALRVALAGIDYRACAALAGRESGGQE